MNTTDCCLLTAARCLPAACCCPLATGCWS